MIGRSICFVDTNVFVYAHQPREQPVKQPIAEDWLERIWLERRGRTSVQVLNECYTVLTGKMTPTNPAADVWQYVMWLMTWNPCAVDTQVVKQARQIECRYGLSWWDCLIVAAAQVQGCDLLLTEDLDNNGIYGGVRVCNPFDLAVQDVA
jgi:predicted nucleic acid-binding protein